ncbi:MAG: HEPN domain-containing protein [Oscillospiraceae bacterium]|nr:HEPN domain-containing protein [Oscillospiraceae bacterium]
MDMDAATTLDKHMHPRPLEIICYHAEQCAEKMLKGFLVENGILPPKTHDLPLLCDKCIEIEPRFSEISDICDFLTAFGVQPRYPDELTILDEDADKSLTSIQKVMSFFKSLSIEENEEA